MVWFSMVKALAGKSTNVISQESSPLGFGPKIVGERCAAFSFLGGNFYLWRGYFKKRFEVVDVVGGVL